MDVRTVVTGLGEQGDTKVTSDGRVTDVVAVPDIPGWEVAAIATTPPDLVLPRTADPAPKDTGVPPGATQFLVWRLPPVENGPNPWGMHTTDTVDYVTILSGRVSMLLGDGTEVELHQGDCVVQNGTRHEWINRSRADCVMAVFVVGARRA
jgi:mannose-6-phosphate isomerase-like protein (cupin superfamily)